MNKDSFEDIFKRIKNGTAEDKQNVAKELREKLNQDQKNALSEVLNDKSLMEKLLNSKAAEEIKRKMGEENGHK